VRPDQRRRTIGVRKGLKGRSRYSVNAPDKAGGSVRSTDATAMQPGDGVFLYHSSCAVPGIAGLAKVATAAYPDPTQFDKNSDYYDPKSTREEPRWSLVDVKFDRKFKRTITLDEIKQHGDALGEGFALIQRGNRLSVLPVTAAQWKFLLALE